MVTGQNGAVGELLENALFEIDSGSALLVLATGWTPQARLPESGERSPACGGRMNRQTVHVTIYDRDGHSFTHSVLAASFHYAVQSAARWFEHRDGNPKPTRDTVYELSVPGDSRRWRVCGGTVQAVQRQAG